MPVRVVLFYRSRVRASKCCHVVTAEAAGHAGHHERPDQSGTVADPHGTPGSRREFDGDNIPAASCCRSEFTHSRNFQQTFAAVSAEISLVLCVFSWERENLAFLSRQDKAWLMARHRLMKPKWVSKMRNWWADRKYGPMYRPPHAHRHH
jgi:hypothetical protein